MIAAVTYALLGPVLVYRLRYRGQSPRGRWLPGLTAPTRDHPPGADKSRGGRLAVLATTTGLLLVAAAAVPRVTSGGAFARNQALGVALELGTKPARDGTGVRPTADDVAEPS